MNLIEKKRHVKARTTYDKVAKKYDKEEAKIDVGPVHIDTDSDPVQVKIILAVAILLLFIFIGIAIDIGVRTGVISFHWSKTVEQAK